MIHNCCHENNSHASFCISHDKHENTFSTEHKCCFDYISEIKTDKNYFSQKIIFLFYPGESVLNNFIISKALTDNDLHIIQQFNNFILPDINSKVVLRC